uniref:DUF3278 domain-containing protein n=1 Tax=Strongyloides venezuelensis TaxID=75913 RepID=A0A0K0F6A8_STRVS
MCRMKMIPIFSTDSSLDSNVSVETFETIQLNENKSSLFTKDNFPHAIVNMHQKQNTPNYEKKFYYYFIGFCMIYYIFSSCMLFLSNMTNILSLQIYTKERTDKKDYSIGEEVSLFLCQIFFVLFAIVVVFNIVYSCKEILDLVGKYFKKQKVLVNEKLVKYKKYLMQISYIYVACIVITLSITLLNRSPLLFYAEINYVKTVTIGLVVNYVLVCLLFFETYENKN